MPSCVITNFTPLNISTKSVLASVIVAWKGAGILLFKPTQAPSKVCNKAAHFIILSPGIIYVSLAGICTNYHEKVFNFHSF